MVTARRLLIHRRYLHIPVRYDARAGLMRVLAGGKQVLKFAAKVTAGTGDYVTFADLAQLVARPSNSPTTAARSQACRWTH